MWILNVLFNVDDDTVLPQMSISPNVSNIAYLIETSIENMDIVAWFPL